MTTLSKIATQVHEARRILNMFSNMHRRCSDPKFESYPQYGGRGITVCERWLNLDLFEADIKMMLAEQGLERLPVNFSLERRDGNGNYCPENCALVDRRVQARNKSNVVRVIYDEQEITVVELCEKLNLHPNSIKSRLRQGFSIEEAITRPTRLTYQDYLQMLERKVARYDEIKEQHNARRRAAYAQRKQQQAS